MLSPMAAIEKIPIWIEIESQYSLNSLGAKQSRITPRMAKLRLIFVGKIVVSAAYEERKSPEGMREGPAMSALSFLPRSMNHDCAHVLVGMIVTENRFP